MSGPHLLPTFVRVIQLEDVWVRGVVRQLRHPAHDGYLFAGCGFVLWESDTGWGLGCPPGPSQVPPIPQATMTPPPIPQPHQELTCFRSVPRRDLAP